MAFVKSDSLKLLIKQLLAEDLAIRQVITHGSSASRVYLAEPDESELVAIKIDHAERVPMSLYEERYRLLKKLYPKNVVDLMSIKKYGTSIVSVMSAPSTFSLHGLIKNNVMEEKQYIEIWQGILNEIGISWRKSRRSGFDIEDATRPHLARVQRIFQGLNAKKAFNADLDTPLLLKGFEETSLMEMMALANSLRGPGFAISCHGDPHPANIVLSPSMKWFWIDFEWVGENHDWRMMFAHLYGWWACNYMSLNEIKVKNNKNILIDYKVFMAPIQRRLQGLAVKLFNENSTTKSRKEDAKAINIYLMLLYLGEIRFIPKQNKHVNAYKLLAMALECACYAKILNNNKVSGNEGVAFRLTK